jgi:hypothetical protein
MFRGERVPVAGPRVAVLVVALRKLLPRRAEVFEAGLPGEGEDPLGDNIGLVQLVQVPARDGRGGPTEGESGGPIFGIGVAEREVRAGIAVPVHRQTDGRPQVAEGMRGACSSMRRRVSGSG